MKTIQQAMDEEVYLKADKLAKKLRQTVGEKNDYYITLEQLMNIIGEFYE